jgi:hypothetical protein
MNRRLPRDKKYKYIAECKLVTLRQMPLIPKEIATGPEIEIAFPVY